MAPMVPLRLCTHHAASITARLVAVGQAGSQRSTENAQARYGNSSGGQVCGFHSSRSGTGSAAASAAAQAVLRSSVLAEGGRRSRTSLIGRPQRQVEAGAPGGLAAADDDIVGRLGEFHALYAFHVQHGVDGRAANVAPDAALRGNV